MENLQLNLNVVQLALLLDLLVSKGESLKNTDAWSDIDRGAACNTGDMFLQIINILKKKQPETLKRLQRTRNIDGFLRFFEGMSKVPGYYEALKSSDLLE